MFDFKKLEEAYHLSSKLLNKGIKRISINPNLVVRTNDPYCYGYLHIHLDNDVRLLFTCVNAAEFENIINKLSISKNIENDFIEYKVKVENE